MIIFGIFWFMIGKTLLGSFFYHSYSPLPNYVTWLYLIVGVFAILDGLYDLVKKLGSDK
jgi:hypothetical protein